MSQVNGPWNVGFQDAITGALLGKRHPANWWHHYENFADGSVITSSSLKLERVYSLHPNQRWVMSGSAIPVMGSAHGACIDSGGGLKMTVNSLSSRKLWLRPYAKAGFSGLGVIKFGTEDESYMAVRLRTGAAITTMQLTVGFMLTHGTAAADRLNADSVMTDANAVRFIYNATKSATALYGVENVGSTTATVTELPGVTWAIDTDFYLQLAMQTDRTCQMWVNGVLVHTTAALTNDIDLIPFVSLRNATATGAGSQRRIYVRSIELGKNLLAA
jgi:hypothetical protein